MTNTTCEEHGCQVQEGEWCEYHKTERWDCTCLGDNIDPICSVHGTFDWKGKPAVDDNEGYPPDQEEAGWIELPGGGYLAIGADAYTKWCTATADLEAGFYVALSGSEASPYVWHPGTIPDGVAATTAALGGEIHVVVFGTVSTKDTPALTEALPEVTDATI